MKYMIPKIGGGAAGSKPSSLRRFNLTYLDGGERADRMALQ